MLRGPEIAQARLDDWRKLAQGLHTRYLVPDFAAAARFVVAVGEAGDDFSHHPRVRIGQGCVDLEVVSDDAIYREDDGTEIAVEWVTRQDVDLAREISRLASHHGLAADPAAVTEIELGLDTSTSASVAPFWAALLTGDPASQGRGTPGDEIRDPTMRVPNLWFGDVEEGAAHAGRFHVEVYVAPEQLAGRVAAALAAGGSVVDDSDAPGLTVLADPEGNRGVLCCDTSAILTD